MTLSNDYIIISFFFILVNYSVLNQTLIRGPMNQEEESSHKHSNRNAYLISEIGVEHHSPNYSWLLGTCFAYVSTSHHHN